MHVLKQRNNDNNNNTLKKKLKPYEIQYTAGGYTFFFPIKCMQHHFLLFLLPTSRTT
jgi:hypothetical protein